MRGKRSIWYLMAALVIVSAGVVLQRSAAQDVQPYVDLPSGGTWEGTAYFGPEAQQLAAPITFEVGANGAVTGLIRFTFRYEGMPENLVQLIDTYGCVTAFSAVTPESQPVSGYFMDAVRAVGTFSTSACYLEEYGDLAFASPVSGVWYAEHGGSSDVVFAIQPTEVDGASASEAPTATVVSEPTSVATTTGDTSSGADYDPEFMAYAIEVFLDQCSECHGVFGEGGPGVADLTDRKVVRMTDEDLLEIINDGVEGTEMEAWERILTEEEKEAVILVIRNPEVLKDRYR